MTESGRIEPWLSGLRAPNPSAMTGAGTNSWILGTERLVVIDPGPKDPAHLAALSSAIAGRRVEAILVTHAHLDHSALVPDLARLTGAPVLGFGPAEAGRSALMQALAAGGQGGGEGRDTAFAPDTCLRDGQILTLAGLRIEVIHTPGHMAGHLCFAVGDALFSGDHVMGWSSSLVSPPDGDMAAYRQSLRKLMARGEAGFGEAAFGGAGAKQADRGWRIFYPGHGAAVTDPAARLSELLAHRAAREAAILEALHLAPATPDQLVARIYTGVPDGLRLAARRSVFAHLIDLHERNKVTSDPELSDTARYTLI